MRLRLQLMLVAVAAMAAACSAYSPRGVQPGLAADEVVSRMGQPTAVHALPGGGRRLEYARGPAGLHTFMVDLDPQGRVTGWEQVLTEAHFAAIPPGMPVQELRRRIGSPSQVRSGGRQPGQVWSYRFDSPFCQWWQVDIVEGRTGRAAYGNDPRCEFNEPVPANARPL